MPPETMLAVTIKMPPKLKADLEHAYSEGYTSFPEGVRGTLNEYLLQRQAKTTEKALQTLETCLIAQLAQVKAMRQNNIIEVRI